MTIRLTQKAITAAYRYKAFVRCAKEEGVEKLAEYGLRICNVFIQLPMFGETALNHRRFAKHSYNKN